MKNNFKTILMGAAALMAFSLKAQETPVQPAESSKCKMIWSAGLSGTVIDDDGLPFSQLFDVGNSWQFLPFPTRLHVDAACGKNWSFEGAFTYSKYKSGKLLNEVALTEDHTFIAFDAHAKYHFLQNKYFDPYGVGGLGFTYRSALEYQTPNLNLGIGFNIWFVDNFGINLQSTAKFKMNTKSSNYLQHSAGLVYRFVK